MNENKQLEKIRGLIENASANIAAAKQILADMTGVATTDMDYQSKASGLAVDGKVIEGIFDGQYMIDSEGKKYPVPANYASKSKLVTGDVLKLTIMNDGSFVYKQIGPVERKKVIGSLVQEGDDYKVVAGGKAYKVLLASVTYFKLKTGDEITILVPEQEDTEWAAIESAVIEPGDLPTTEDAE